MSDPAAEIPELKFRVCVYRYEADEITEFVADRMFRDAAELADAERAGVFSERARDSEAVTA